MHDSRRHSRPRSSQTHITSRTPGSRNINTDHPSVVIIATIIFVTFLALHTAFLGKGGRKMGILGARGIGHFFLLYNRPAHTWPLNPQSFFEKGVAGTQIERARFLPSGPAGYGGTARERTRGLYWGVFFLLNLSETGMRPAYFIAGLREDEGMGIIKASRGEGEQSSFSELRRGWLRWLGSE